MKQNEPKSDFILQLPNSPQHRSDLAQDFTIFTFDGSKSIVGGEQPDVSVLLRECLGGCLAVDHGSNDVALLAVFMRADDNVVAVADFGSNRGINKDPGFEELSLAKMYLGGELFGSD